jgi:L-alanine-DL-glutamate epimerase-like enolase superfamily enzyme
VKLKFYRLNIPFTATFKHNSAVRVATQSVWVEAYADDIIGVGEGCPREYVTDENLKSVETFFDAYHDVLCQEINSVEDLVEWADDHTEIIDANPAAWCAIELAMLELFSRRRNITIEQVVGVAPITGKFCYSAVVGDGEPQIFQATVAQYIKMGFVDFKLKLSGDSIRDRNKIATFRDLENIKNIRVRIDANNLWKDADTAVQYLADLDFSFAGIEEPLPANAIDEMRIVSERIGCPIILDESLLRADQLATLIKDPEKWIVNVRVSKMGGLLRSLAVIKSARDLGILLIVGAQVGETSVLTRAGLVVAHAVGNMLFAQEGAFGTYLLKEDVAVPSLMFDSSGVLDSDSHELSSKIGWGLTFHRKDEFVTLLS